MLMRTAVTAAAGLAAVALLGGACGLPSLVVGSGNARTESRQVSGVERVTVHGTGTLLLRQGDAEALTIRADDNILPRLRSTVGDGQLDLGPTGGDIQPRTPIEYDLTVRTLRSLHLEGSVDATSDHLSTQQLELHVEGSGGMNLADLAATAVSAHLQGSGSASLKGQADSQDVQLEGSARYHAADLATRRASVRIEGSGGGEVSVRDSLDAHIEGSGRLVYSGSPAVRQQVEGSGSVTKG